MGDAPAKDQEGHARHDTDRADSLGYGATESGSRAEPRASTFGSRAEPRASTASISGTSSADHQSPFDALLRAAASTAGPPHARLPAVGEVVAGRYRIEERLGEGGMGAVFRATHVISDKQVAIKWMLRPASDEHARLRFVREARAAARIEHPNVVDVYDVGQHGQAGLYLVMQLLRGESLRARIARASLTASEAVDLLLPAMRGVSAVHRAGIVHRDLKPDNIFLCVEARGSAREQHHESDGRRVQAKVLDFGISAMTGGDAADPTLTGDGAALGTPSYMSPEQLRDSRSVDARTDVYAFGIILYETLTRELPFNANSYNGLVLAIVNSSAKNPCELRPELPPELGQVVLRALAKDREARFPSMDALIDALSIFGESARESARMPRSLQPARKSTHKRGLAWRLGILLLACAVGSWLWLRGASEPHTAGSQTSRSEPSADKPAPTSSAATPPPQRAQAHPPEALPSTPRTERMAPAELTAPPRTPVQRSANTRKHREVSQKPAPSSAPAKELPVPVNRARSGRISPTDL